MIEIKNVTKKYGTVTALKGLSLTIQSGELFGLLGPNGAGKSTLINLLTGYLNSDSGEMTIFGQPVSANARELKRVIGFVPQSLALYEDLSAEENLRIFGSLYLLEPKLLHERSNALLEQVGLFERRKSKVKEFSGGMKRRLNLIAALVHDPSILLCDEPTVGVDPQSRNALFDFLMQLNEEGKTIIYTTHYMEEAEKLCSRIAIIDLGEIITQGTIEELIEALPFGRTVQILKTPHTLHIQNMLKEFGEVIDLEDRFELKPSGEVLYSRLFSALEKEGVPNRAVEMRKPSLETLFLHLTGRSLRD